MTIINVNAGTILQHSFNVTAAHSSDNLISNTEKLICINDTTSNEIKGLPFECSLNISKNLVKGNMYTLSFTSINKGTGIITDILLDNTLNLVNNNIELEDTQTHTLRFIYNGENPNIIFYFNNMFKYEVIIQDFILIEHNMTLIDDTNVNFNATNYGCVVDSSYNLTFDGKSSYVKTNQSHLLDYRSLSVVSIIKPNSNTIHNNDRQYIFSSSSKNTFIECYLDSNASQLFFKLAGINRTVEKSINYNFSEITFVIISITDDRIKLYINGNIVADDFIEPVGYIEPSYFYIGSKHGNTSFYNGIIYNLAILNRSLNDFEARSIYDNKHSYTVKSKRPQNKFIIHNNDTNIYTYLPLGKNYVKNYAYVQNLFNKNGIKDNLVIDSIGHNNIDTKNIHSGYCYNFNGLDNYCDMNNSIITKSNGVLTFYIKTLKSDQHIIGGDWNSANSLISLKDGRICIPKLTNGNTQYMLGSNKINDGKWHFYTLKYVENGKYLMGYLDNQIDFYNTVFDDDLKRNFLSIKSFGYNSKYEGNYFEGNLFDIRLYNGDKDESELSYISNHGVDIKQQIAFYKMDESMLNDCYNSIDDNYHMKISGDLSSFHINQDLYSFHNESGYAVDSNGRFLPKNEKLKYNSITTDSLVHTGNIKYNAQLIDSNCLTLNSNDNIIIGDVRDVNKLNINFGLNIRSIGDNTTVFYNEDSFKLVLKSTGKLAFSYSIDGETYIVKDSNIYLELNKEYSIKVEINSVMCKLYVNGKLDFMLLLSNYIYDNNKPFIIGNNSDNSSSISLYNFNINDKCLPFSEGYGQLVYDTDNHLYAINTLDINNLWNYNQDLYHYNINNDTSPNINLSDGSINIGNIISENDIIHELDFKLNGKLNSDIITITSNDTKFKITSLCSNDFYKLRCIVDGTEIESYTIDEELNYTSSYKLLYYFNSTSKEYYVILNNKIFTINFNTLLIDHKDIKLGGNDTNLNLFTYYGFEISKDINLNVLKYFVNKVVFNRSNLLKFNILKSILPETISNINDLEIEGNVGLSYIPCDQFKAGYWFKPCETKLIQKRAPRLINNDINNFYFDEYNEPKKIGYLDLYKNSDSYSLEILDNYKKCELIQYTDFNNSILNKDVIINKSNKRNASLFKAYSKDGIGLHLDNATINLNDSYNINAITSWSMSFWYKPMEYNTKGKDYLIIGKDAKEYYITQNDASIRIVHYGQNDKEYKVVDLLSEPLLEANTYNHIVFSYDNTKNIMLVYINTKLAGKLVINEELVLNKHNENLLIGDGWLDKNVKGFAEFDIAEFAIIHGVINDYNIRDFYELNTMYRYREDSIYSISGLKSWVNSNNFESIEFDQTSNMVLKIHDNKSKSDFNTVWYVPSLENKPYITKGIIFNTNKYLHSSKNIWDANSEKTIVICGEYTNNTELAFGSGISDNFKGSFGVNGNSFIGTSDNNKKVNFSRDINYEKSYNILLCSKTDTKYYKNRELMFNTNETFLMCNEKPYLGCGYTTQYPFNGTIYEVLIFDKVLNNKELDIVSTYIENTHNIK